MFFKKKRNLTFLQIYILESIRWLDPKYIITFTDHNIFFIQLKKYFPDKKIILFQDTYRGADTFEILKSKFTNLIKKNKKKIKIDYFFLFGKEIGKFYRKYFKTKFIFHGSARNNLITTKRKIKKNCLVLISNFSHLKIYKNREYKIIKALNLFKKYCEKYKLKIVVFGRATSGNEVNETNFYDEIFGQNKYLYYPKGIGNHYQNSEKYQYFFNFTSTFGYELATRGKRVIFIYAPLIKEQNVKLQFAYPKKIKSYGSFWTKSFNEKEIFRIVNYIRKVSDKNWRKKVKKLIRPVIEYDPNNIKAKKVLNT